MSRFVFTLYVAGHTSRAEQAIATIRQLCAAALGDRYDLEIIDVLEQPQAAERARVLATPTLVREQPTPRRRIIGDMSDSALVLRGLNIQPPRDGQGEDA
jgi:circadian clock protein KaiB